ncbi:MAG: hypothetical protein ACOYMW_16625 [Candidatus Competibacteraceae bacterium]
MTTTVPAAVAPFVPAARAALAIDGDPICRAYHLSTVLGINDRSLAYALRAGKVPQPDIMGGRGRSRFWRVSSLRAWSPDVGDAICLLLTNPAFHTAAR